MELKNLFKKNVLPPEPEGRETHSHAWVEIARTYARPRRDVSANGYSEEIFQRTLFGATNILYECKICHEHKSETLLGSTEDTLEDLCDKALEIGTQYFQKDNETFTISKWTPGAPTGLPVR